MAIRQCPHCSKIVPAGTVIAHSDGLQCPFCESRLEVNIDARGLATWIGLIAGFLVWYFTRMMDGDISWVLPEFYAIVVSGAVAALVLMFTAELCLEPDLPILAGPVTHHAPSHGGHGGGHH